MELVFFNTKLDALHIIWENYFSKIFLIKNFKLFFKKMISAHTNL